MERLDAFVSRLSTRSNFWNRVCSMIWLPYAFKSGIQMRRLDGETFSFELPFRRFNRNWYNAMAGAALLGNAEIAGGTYIFGVCGADYTVVCKHLEYNFLRPCLGPAIYRVKAREDVQQLMADGGEFNLTVDMEIMQSALANLHPTERKRLKQRAERTGIKPDAKRARKEKRVGRCTATFHITPKHHQKAKGRNA
jgi:acyl-coenzyme A thioesterase PaaI-like protein